MLSSQEIRENYHTFDHTPIAFAIIEVLKNAAGEVCDFVFRYINDASIDLIGHEREKLLDKPFMQFPNAVDKWLKPYGETAFTGKKNVITDLSPELGKYLHIECYQICEGLCGCVLTDITEDIRHRRQLEIEHESYEIAMELSGQHYWEYDMWHDRAIQSAISQSTFDLPVIMENYPQSWLETNLLLSEYWGTYLDIHKKLKEGVREISMEGQIWPSHSEKPRWIKIMYRNIFDDQGKPVKAIGVSVDITERKNLEEAFHEFNGYQQLAMKSKLDLYRLNITKDTIMEIKDTMGLLQNDGRHLSMMEFFAKSAKSIHLQTDNLRYREVYSRDNMLDRYRLGQKHSEVECLYTLPDGKTKYLRMTLQMTQHPLTRDIIGVTYAEDITEENLRHLTLSRYIAHSCDLIMCIHARTGQFMVVEHDPEFALPAMRGDSFENAIMLFYKERVANDEEYKARVRDLRLWNLVKNLKDQDEYIYSYITQDHKGHRHRHNLEFYYVNKDEQWIGMAYIHEKLADREE